LRTSGRHRWAMEHIELILDAKKSGPFDYSVE